MPEIIEVPTWPSCTSALKWSQDDKLAIGLQDRVILILPRLAPSLARVRGAQGTWDTITLETSDYPEDKVPYQTHRPWHVFQIGEELSDRHTAAIDWSPPGIGKHGSCVLAVLTSDHVLSCWECIGRPERSEDWRRAIIINIALGLTAYHASKMRAWRIRSFAWAPALKDSTGQLMAVAKDNGSVELVRFNPGETWSLQIVHSFEPFADADSHSVINVLPSATHLRPPYIDQLSWSPWLIDTGAGRRSRIVFACQSRLYCATIVSTPEIVVFDPVRFLQDIPDLAGPLSWAPTGLTLVTFHKTDVAFHTFQDSFEPAKTVTIPADLEWDTVSGLGFHGQEPSFVYTPLTSLTRQTGPLSSTPGETSSSQWRKDIRLALTDWEARNELPQRGTVKTYGIAFSPSGHHSAVGMSYHANDRLEYIIDSFKNTTVIVSRLHDPSEQELLPSDMSLQDASSESLLLDLVQLGAGKSPRYDLASTIGISERPTTVMEPPVYSHDIQEIIMALRHRLDSPSFRRQKHNRLIQLALTDELSRVLPDLDTISLILTEILALPAFLSQGTPTTVAVCRKVQGHIKSRQANLDPNTNALSEQCPTCGDEILLEAVRWARCAKRHTFARCGFSFVAIPQKHPTKVCSLCDVTYIDTPMDTLDHNSLAYVLQAACTNCVYCGGRFVG